MTDTQELLSKVDIFRSLSNRDLKKIIKSAREINHLDGHVIASEGKGALAFHLILSGSAVVSRGRTAKRSIGPGDYFGEISMIDGAPRSATVTADGPLTTLAISHVDFNSLVHDEPEVARGLLVLLCQRLRQAEANTAT